MTWIEGRPLRSLLSAPLDVRSGVVRSVVQTFLSGLLRSGWVHGDMHEGNVTVSWEGGGYKVGLLDFGCCVEIPDGARDALWSCLDSIELGECSAEKAFDHFVRLGFDGASLAPMRRKLPALLEVLFARFLPEERARMVAGRSLGEAAAQILGDDRILFRIAAPPRAVYLIRSFVGIAAIESRLGSRANWRLALPERPLRMGNATAVSSQLSFDSPEAGWKVVIRAFREGKEPVVVTLPFAALERVSELVPPEYLQEFSRSAFDGSALMEKAREPDYRGGALVDLLGISGGRVTIEVSR